MSAVLSQGPIFIVSLVFMLGVVVIVHELGHYIAGRWFGAAAESFSVGFGRPIYERKDKRGTRWRINWIPIGGFVKFVGESQLPNDVGLVEQGPVGKTFAELGPGQRSVIALGGPVANFLLAILLFAIMFMANGRPEHSLTIADTIAGEPAAAAGFQAGDIVRTVNGKPVKRTDDLLLQIKLGTGIEQLIGIERDGQQMTIGVVPERVERENALGQMTKLGAIGVQLSIVNTGTVHYGPISAIGAGAEETWTTVALTGKMLGRMVTGKEPLAGLSGPVAIGDITRRAVNRTMEVEASIGQRLSLMGWTILNLCALISVGIGLFNLLPLPVLDGGHLVFNAYEAATGKSLPEKVQEVSLTFGLILLLGMAVIITWGDILETGIFRGSGG